MNTSAANIASHDEISAAHRQAAEREADRVRQGAAIVGHKVGYTNRSTWAKMGVHEPMWGAMYDDTVVHITASPFRYATQGVNGPRIEPEIVLRFHRAPKLGDSLQELLACVEWMAQGFEIVVTPIDGKPPTVPQAIVNGGMHGALLIGETRPLNTLGDNLVERLGSDGGMRCNEELKESGVGANVLDNPLNSIIQLVEGRQRQGQKPLEAGAIVTTGTLTSAYHIAKGDRWTTTLKGLDLPDLDVIFE